ncbi:MAG: YIP1 family protein [Coriobacteriia bacterium]|nr:YIP1 family protein [Coriobacteriia bacterium]
MRSFASILLGLFRPARGIDGAGSAVKWLWVPLAIILLASVLFKTAVSTPMKIEAQTAEAQAIIQEQIESMPEADQKQYEKDMATAEASGQMTEDEALNTAMQVTSVADIVFGALGALMAIVYTATFFFIAAKTWANPVTFTTMLTVGALSLLPNAIRNFIQGAYMASSGVWLRFSGLGALVAPKEVTEAPGAAYAVLSQIDLFVIWGLLVLFGTLLSKTIGIDKKRAAPAMLAFIVVTGIVKAIPVIVSSLFAGAVM